MRSVPIATPRGMGYSCYSQARTGMTLDEYILMFRDLSSRSDLSEPLRAHARHLYICLALDLPSAIEARSKLLAEAQHKNLESCGPNVPSVFEAKLVERLEHFTSSSGPPEKIFKTLFEIFSNLVAVFIDSGNPGFNPRDPFCRCDCNEQNRSFSQNGQLFCRYLDLDTFEKHLLFPGKAGPLTVTPNNRRYFYSHSRVSRLSSTPNIFGLQRDQQVLLGRPPTTINGSKTQSVVFLVPYEEAPHRTKPDASYIASQLGLPTSLKSASADARKNNGFAVLKFHPDKHDPLYRPTILDAHEHQAFRPGPPDVSMDSNGFKHGWTRVFKSGELLTDNASIADELGCKEVIMPSRWERFPSEALELETVCFFEP